MESVKIMTWNVNGLRSILRKNFYEFTAQHRPDILCLQETRVSADTCPTIDGFQYTYFNHSEHKKGYSGTAILSRVEPYSVCCLDADAEHPEGRILVAEFKTFFLVNTYVPNAQGDLRRLPYRVQVWDRTVRERLKKLQKTKPVLWCGDLNVAHQPIDLAYPEANRFSAGFTDEERQSFEEHLNAGFTDVFRHFHPHTPQCYTWWSYRMRARERNIGWRIDYFLASEALLPSILSCRILSDVFGSDHAPAEITIKRDRF